MRGMSLAVIAASIATAAPLGVTLAQRTTITNEAAARCSLASCKSATASAAKRLNVKSAALRTSTASDGHGG
jgi:hypothetical protein